MDIIQAQASSSRARFIPGQKAGHYESFFLRANHPLRASAFWIRYTIFSPQDRPENAIGELWAISFNGDTGRHVAAKMELPISGCSFARDRLDVNVGDSVLTSGMLKGSIKNDNVSFEWDLTYTGSEKPLFWFPVKYYTTCFPKAKGLVSLPHAVFTGNLIVNGEKIRVDGWTGSENHNWGLKHTDHYAWGQVAGFDNSPESFLEIATARIKLGPLWSPFITPVILRHEGIEYNLNDPLTSLFRASFSYYHWKFKAQSDAIELNGTIHAEPEDFVCLTYYNPPGGTKFCLNSKIAACDLTFTIKKTGQQIHLAAAKRAAFEILTDKDDHGLKPAV
jgi:hypothetical protein